jgi:ABC-type multidrug transport system fused ATPase/permease subunit
MMGDLPIQVANVFFIGGIVGSIALGSWLFGIGAISLGGVYAIYRYVALIRQPINQIGRQFQELQQAGAAISRIEALFA